MDLMVTFADSTYELNGIYRENGTLNGYPSYKHESKDYYIFADNGGHYVLNNTTAMPDPCYFYGPQGSPIGTYSLGIFGSGNPPTVTEYVDSSGTVTGFEVSGAVMVNNGIYSLTDLNSGYASDPRVFSDGSYYLARFRDNGGWYFSQNSYNCDYATVDGSVCLMFDNAITSGTPTAAQPSDVSQWFRIMLFDTIEFSVTPIYGEDGGNEGGGDTPSGGKVIAYVVDNSGSKENHGTYNYVGDDDNGYPRYEMIAEAGMSLQIYWGDTYMPPGAMGWMLRNPGGTAYAAPNSPADSTPENATWITGQSGSAPVPTFTPVYEDVPDEPDTPDTPDTPDVPDVPDDPVLPDEDEPEKISAPAVGDKGIKINNVFIPVCPDPADCNFNRITEVGKAAAVGWLAYDFGNAVDIPAANVEYQAGLPGWVSVTVAGNNAALAVKVYPVSGSENTGTGFARSTAAGDLQGTVFVPEGYFYKIVTANNIISAKFFPCGK